jgi:hypothetical protein
MIDKEKAIISDGLSSVAPLNVLEKHEIGQSLTRVFYLGCTERCTVFGIFPPVS